MSESSNVDSSMGEENEMMNSDVGFSEIKGAVENWQVPTLTAVEGMMFTESDLEVSFESKAASSLTVPVSIHDDAKNNSERITNTKFID